MPEFSRSQLLAYALAGVIVVVLGVRFMQRQQGAAAEAAPAATGAGAREAPRRSSGTVRIERSTGSTQLVHVAGAVRRPGVYRLGAGARVHDAVERAGGPAPRADVNAVNLAAKVTDGQQIVVPSRLPGAAPAAGSPAAAAAATPGAAPAAASGPVSLNSATVEQLETLDGIGPATAAKIVEWRTQNGGFRSVDDLSQVPGIGPKRIGALRGQVQP